MVIDRAYAEITFDPPRDGRLAGAALTLPGAMRRTVELHSLSKSCGLAGWRLGFAVGAQALIARMRTLKFNTDFGTFLPLQQVAIEMLDQLEEIAARNSAVYAQRMRRFVAGANALGWKIAPSDGTFFLWAKLPEAFAGGCDLDFVERVLDETGVLMAPGSGFGPGGAGYVRIALVSDLATLDEALARLSAWFAARAPLELAVA
ncbi:MAG: pyridoxal phosphate-dependent aminotransferase [Lysobacter sp.]